MFIKRQAQELRFMTQQKLHSVRSTGTATAILMSPDPPVLRAKVWLARLVKRSCFLWRKCTETVFAAQERRHQIRYFLTVAVCWTFHGML